MFDTNKVASNIKNARTKMNMTQTNLADEMGVSYQAVSNWERGISMPDISKLGELSELFDVSIDEILENKRASKIAEKVLNNEKVEDIKIEEIKEIAPALKEEQADKLFEDANFEDLSINDLVMMAPFLSEDVIDEIAIKLVN